MKEEKKTSSRKQTTSKAGEMPAVRKTVPPQVRPAETGKSGAPVAQAVSAAKPESELPQHSATQAEPVARKRALPVPPLLLEGDEPNAPSAGVPGQRHALDSTSPPEPGHATGESGELPEAYGTKKLLLTARDPNWLYTHWDLTREQLRECNRCSADGHLVLRVYVGNRADELFVEVHVHPESRNWFVHVGRGGTQFVAELGYYAKGDGRWTGVSVSAPTLTPPDTLSSDTAVHFASIPIEVPFQQLLAVVQGAVSENVPLAEAIQQLRAAGFSGLPGPQQIRAGQWTAAQERALSELISMDNVRRVWMGSLEITELIRRRLVAEIPPAPDGKFSLAAEQRGDAVTSISSPFGGGERGKGFWFNVNAELIIYGATEPHAKVTIGGRPITLRPDGSFSIRLALPDGDYELLVVAVSTDQTDGRAAQLKFNRRTQYRGEVGVHPQAEGLTTPHPVNAA